MLGTAGILIHWAPGINQFPINWAELVVWCEVAIPVPRGIDEGVHRVGLTLAGAAALRAGDIEPRGRRLQWRLTSRLEVDIIRKGDGELLHWHADRAAGFAVNDRDRCAPVALAADQPVAQAIGDLLLAALAALEMGDRLGE